jgi:hypothetical protein
MISNQSIEHCVYSLQGKTQVHHRTVRERSSLLSSLAACVRGNGLKLLYLAAYTYLPTRDVQGKSHVGIAQNSHFVTL